ncbi:hypothetical protein J4H86_15245 [Spiractinospora alimapuensis]|uniref:hypothetical protein n=1 Tax=Spiractinospora alimapuensis TaxID=2820884 RepID=UPI001F1A80B4|nr:hypothetical protein [Spiractinospora alimapuensis]QVQ50303.1 hypothetical protein J4H86_15245 [Spiractinospora alimapuensis]
MVRMKLAALRHGSSGSRTVGAVLGIVLALGTVWVGVLAPAPAVAGLVAAILGVWTVGWLVGPSGVGGGDETLKPEYFALLPLPRRTVAVGLLCASFVGVTVPVTVVALLSLLTLALRYGALPVLVAVVAIPLQLLVIVLASKVLTALWGAALRTRIGIEITAIQSAAILATGFSVYMLYQAASHHADVASAMWNEGLPTGVTRVALLLPSGWGVAAVNAAGEGRWLVVLGALVGLAVFSVLLLAAWSALIQRRVTRPTTGDSRGARRRSWHLQRLMPSTPVGAVVGRELRSWSQDPRRALELRTALWTGLLVCVLGLAVGLTFMIPLAGLITLALAALMSLNTYAQDGSALWQTLLVPDAARGDVRGRQLGWLIVFVPIALAVSVGGILLTGQSWAWPWVAAAAPALVGGGAGLSVLFAVTWPAPGADPHRHGGNPLDSGSVVAQFNVMFPLMLFVAAPPTAVTALGYLTDNPTLMWSGTAVGVAFGTLLAWGLGRVAHRRLQRRGPELLSTLRWGASPEPDASQPGEEGGGTVTFGVVARAQHNLETLSSARGAALSALGLTFWLPLYQGVVSLVGVLVGTDNPSWHLPLYLPAPLQIPGSVGMLLLGVLMIVAMGRIVLRPVRTQPEVDGVTLAASATESDVPDEVVDATNR